MDVKTLGVAVALTNAALAVVLILAYRMGPKISGPGWWALGQTLVAIGVLLRNFGADTGWLRLVIPLWIAMVIGGFMLVYVGLLRFFGRRPSPWILPSALGACLVGVTWYTFGDNLLHARGVILYGCVAIIFGACAWRVWQLAPASLRRSAVLTLLAFAAAAIVYGVLAAASIARWTQSTPMFAADATTVGAYLGLLATSILWTFSLLTLVSQRLQRDLASQARNLKSVFATSPDCAAISRLSDGRVLDINEGFTRITGFSRAEAVGSSARELGLWSDPSVREQMVRTLEERGVCTDLRGTLRRKDGTVLQCVLTARVLEFDGEPFLVSVTRDITEQLRAEATLHSEATTDDLTGLPNRQQFFSVAEEKLARPQSDGTTLTVALLDIDNFKDINDTLGHAAGDRAAVAFATTMVDLLPAGAFLARLGGDEFGLLMPIPEVDHARDAIDQMRLDVQLRPFELGAGSRSVTFSAGVAPLAESIDVSLARADKALYRAKSAGRNAVVAAHPSTPSADE